MAANQTIQMNGAKGNALVFLAAANNGLSSAPDPSGILTSPAVSAGTPVVGTGCSLGDGDYEGCVVPTGTVTYSGSVDPQSYSLEVPDWVSGPTSAAVVMLPHRNSPTGQENLSTKIYAFAIPLQPGATVESVTLPDLSSSAKLNVPGLHIFGMAVRDTTSAPDGSSWTSVWHESMEARFQFTSIGELTNQTIRIIAKPSISGDTLRIHLSNAYGTDPLDINHVTIAPSDVRMGPSLSASPHELTFNNGDSSLVIPEGGEAYSDPISMPVTGGTLLAVSLYLANKVPYITMNPHPSSATWGYLSAVGSGDHTTDVSDSASTAFTSSGSLSSSFSAVVNSIDVTTSADLPTIDVLGNYLIDQGRGVAGISYPLARRFENDSSGAPKDSVVNSGVGGNLLAIDAGGHAGGRAALTRLDRDVLSLPNITTVVVNEALQDAIAGHDDVETERSLSLLRDQLKGWGIKTIFTTLTPCEGYAPCTSTVDTNRRGINTWITDQVDFTSPTVNYLDAESIVGVSDPTSTDDPPALMLNDSYDAGDHVNLDDSGYEAIADGFDLDSLRPDM
ncbi:hypothetical protein [Streptomyces montanisoli]|uniref:SGNH/GDSL hydrolase family protein n=1 Tax=Streptomyces montanisoli TaxID=2798581 RepID=A0A940MI37_9ACTN|nr:hypothetical protein [Streptomyces montanisoli]MBP0461629.1 hypothetical protein [Streptomyces montanisoli]